MMPIINEIPVEIQSENPFGSKNLIQISDNAIKKTTPIKIRSKRLVFMGRNPLRTPLTLLII